MYTVDMRRKNAILRLSVVQLTCLRQRTEIIVFQYTLSQIFNVYSYPVLICSQNVTKIHFI